MTEFIMLHRRIKDKDNTTPTWVNVSNINTISITSEGDGTRIAMRDGFLLVSDDVSEVLEKIRRAADDR